MTRYLPLLFLLSIHANCQVVEINAGSSTLYEATGASAVLHFPNSTAAIGAGFSGGKFNVGGYEERSVAGWEMRWGDYPLAASLGAAALAIPLRGVAATRRGVPVCNRQPLPAARWSKPQIWGVIPCTKAYQLTIFAGGTGQFYSSPFFQAGTTQHIGAGFLYRVDLNKKVSFSSLGGIAGSQRTALGSLDYSGRSLKIQAGGGLLQNAEYWNAEAFYRPTRWLGFDAAHSTYVFESRTVAVDSLSAAALLGAVNVHATFLPGRGETFGAGFRAGWFAANSEILNSGKVRTAFFTTSERLGRHLRISQYLSGRSPSLGAEFQSNDFAAGWSYQLLLYPFQGAAIQRTLEAHISFRIHDASVNLAALLPPIGKILYTAGGSDYFAGPFQNAEVIRHAGSSGGRWFIQGRVLDSAGNPVSGAAVGVDNQILYSDSAGSWQARLRRARPANVRLLPGEFAAPGDWSPLTAPQSVIPSREGEGTTVLLTVSRIVRH